MQFAPTYHDYVLYNNTEGEEGSRKYRARTFVPTGAEMDSARKSRHTFGGKLDDIQLVSLSSSDSSSPNNVGSIPDSARSDAVNTSLLMDDSQSFSLSYDMTLIDIDMSGYSPKVPAVDEAETR